MKKKINKKYVFLLEKKTKREDSDVLDPIKVAKSLPKVKISITVYFTSDSF
jgi:hypothetical protein